MTLHPPFYPPKGKVAAKPRGVIDVLMTMYRNPIEVWSELHFEEPVLFGRSILGTRLVVSDPAAIKRVFLDNVQNYRKDDLQLRVLKPALGEGLLTTEGDVWKAQRHTLSPIFSPRHVAGFAPAMIRVAETVVEDYAGLADGAVLDMADDMARITLRVLEQTLFSQGLMRDPGQFQRAVTQYFETFGRIDPLDLLGAPDFLPRLGRLAGKGSLNFLHKAVDDIITARKALMVAQDPLPDDLLTLLLQAQNPDTGIEMSDNEVRDNIVTFIGAGHETTANSLTWALYLLSQSPDWRARVETEIDSAKGRPPQPFDAEAYPVLRAVLEEAMRLYPPAAVLSRAAVQADIVGGITIPAGTIVTISPYLVHRHKRLWDDPDQFDPQRFLEPNRRKIDRFAFIPFGAGPRICIGMAFAMQEMLIVLSRLLQHYRFDLAPDQIVEPQQRITLRPRTGMRMRVQKR